MPGIQSTVSSMRDYHVQKRQVPWYPEAHMKGSIEQAFRLFHRAVGLETARHRTEYSPLVDFKNDSIFGSFYFQYFCRRICVTEGKYKM
jgi:hypothetical protein